MLKSDQDAIRASTEAIEKMLHGQGLSESLILADPSGLTEPLADLIARINTVIHQYREGSAFIGSLSKGNLDQQPPKNNQFVSYFKQLHSDLLHLRWQTQQIAMGDYDQKVSFMGDFSVSFNKMIESLQQKQVLENELIESEKSLKETAARLQEVIDMKNKLFSIIAHDLRGPIGNTGNLIKLILDGYITDPDEVHRTLRLVYTSSESVFVLLENLLSWSENQSRELNFKPGIFPVKPIFDDTIELYSSALEVKSIVISSQVDAGITANFDPSMIRTVVRNLVNNALKFTPKGGAIRLIAKRSDDQVEIQVNDNGIGMSDEILRSLSDPSTAAVRDGTNHEKGHGLGLTLCRELIQHHGSTLNISSKEGKGSSFSFKLDMN